MKLGHAELLDSPVKITGALDFDRRPAGLSPRRLPAWSRLQVPEAMEPMARMPAGVRLCLTTNSPFVELLVQTTRLVTPPAQPRNVSFDLRINHKEVRHLSLNAGNSILLNPDTPGEFELVRGDAYRVRFEDLPTGENELELWLPHNAFVEIREFILADNASLQSSVDNRLRWLHYGSSISHCMEAESPTGTWPAVAAHTGRQQANLQSFGFGGQCHLDQFVARSIRELPADLISLKVGINIVNGDTMRERVFPSALHGFLDTLREVKTDTPVLLVSPIYCPSAEDNPGPTLPDGKGKFRTETGNQRLRQGSMSLRRVRELIMDVVKARQDAGDQQLHYLSGLELFGPADVDDLPDHLHPNPAGYKRMGERFAERVFNGNFV